MSKKGLDVKAAVRSLKHRSVEYNTEPYLNVLKDINALDYRDLEDSRLRAMSFELACRAKSGAPLNSLLVEAYALVREVSHRVLDMRPFDVQIIAAIAMHDGGLVEMQTGEGKTLAAVFPAYLNALSGKGVHILTFNDYLAQRDSEWMGHVYRFLGLAVGFVKEGMPIAERQRAYRCDITYLTAKEAGFDYLKGFLSYDKGELVHRPFNFALIDEADSILIDEARIPLVIAGHMNEHQSDHQYMAEIVGWLQQETDYETDENERNVYLTDKGLSRVEGTLNCGNLYDGKNTNLLVDVNNALHARVLLKRDVDYIVRKGKIELVDVFTGRVADNRQWPNGLQEAIEAKEGIKPENKGQVIASVTLQNFIRLYPRICGMTGTAVSSADEFLEFYGMKVHVIPTNRTCIRQDLEDVMFTHREAKNRALVEEIAAVHKTGRPILIGTCSVEESEQLAEMLGKAGVDCRVLNARNDELEAHIVANAGAVGAVTVSTNMAGRGTDIKLGGEREEQRERVMQLGGLYVIGTNRHESRRIDNQLRGRAGRQGDPGSTRFYVSFEDDLMKRYRIKELIPPSALPENQEEPLQNPMIRKKILQAQRIVEGQNFDIRRTLCKYSLTMEKQRLMLHRLREDILTGRVRPCTMETSLTERWNGLARDVGSEVMGRVEKQVTLYFINKCWADYLDYMSYIRESIHLVNIAGKVPVYEFNSTAVKAFEKLKEDIAASVVGTLAAARITREGIDMEREGLKVPSSTWTYLVNDRPEQVGMNPVFMNPISAALQLPLMILFGIYYRYFRKTEKLK